MSRHMATSEDFIAKQQRKKRYSKTGRAVPKVMPVIDPNMILRIKDPAVKGNLQYDIRAEFISVTQGLREHVAHLEADHKRPSHRACLCKLWLEGRCSQGTKCKSFHVNVDHVKELRIMHNAELEDTFLNEVVVVASERNQVFAVRFPAVMKTAGLEKYKECHRNDAITPHPLCPDFNPSKGQGGSCPRESACGFIHVKVSELRDLNNARLRTPCCLHHGDVTVCDEFQVPNVTLHGEGQTWSLGKDNLACTQGLLWKVEEGSSELSLKDICAMHIRSRCKFGRACERVHICRNTAEKQGITLVLEPPPSTDLPTTAVSSNSSDIPPLGTPEPLPPVVDFNDDNDFLDSVFRSTMQEESSDENDVPFPSDSADIHFELKEQDDSLSIWWDHGFKTTPIVLW